MWIFQNNSFLSVVQHRDRPELLLVRSRIAGDIERALPSAEVFEDINADYRYRAFVSRDAMKQAMSAAVDRIDYGNFKGSVSERKRHDAYMDVWQAMARAFGAFIGRAGRIGRTADTDPDEEAFLFGNEPKNILERYSPDGWKFGSSAR